MKRVALVSNYKAERCGNAEYGRNLRAQLAREYAVEDWEACPDQPGYDAVVINWCDSVVGFSMEQLYRLKSFNTKLVLIIQNSYSHEHRVSPGDACCVVDRVTAHQPMNIRVMNGHGATQLETFRLIPHGIPEIENLPEYVPQDRPRIGTSGFSLPTKRMESAIRIAVRLNGEALVVAPSHPTYDPRPMWESWRRMAGDKLTLVDAWLPQGDVIRQLATCALNVYMTNELHDIGQSGSAMLTIAARRPTIVQRCAKTASLHAYEDELYFVSSEEEAYSVAYDIWARLRSGGEVKRPNRVMADFGWNHTGKMYRDLLKEVCAQ